LVKSNIAFMLIKKRVTCDDSKNYNISTSSINSIPAITLKYETLFAWAVDQMFLGMQAPDHIQSNLPESNQPMHKFHLNFHKFCPKKWVHDFMVRPLWHGLFCCGPFWRCLFGCWSILERISQK